MKMSDPGDLDPAVMEERRLRDLAVRLALAGYTLPDSLKLLERRHQATHELFETEFTVQQSEIEEKLASEQKRIAFLQEGIEEARLLDLKAKELQTELRKLQERRDLLEAEIRRKRRHGQAAAIEQVANRRAIEARQGTVERLEAELDARQKIYEVEKQCWEINQPELERRKKLLEEEMKRVEAEIGERKGRVAKLKALSITKTVSGFLIWAGYLGFAATGSAISYILAKRLPADGQTPWDSVNALSESLRRLGGGQSSFLGLIYPLAFLLGLLVIIAALVWICDVMLRRFDPRWTARGRSKGFKRRGKTKEDPAESASRSPIAQFFQVPQIERSAFVQLLALLPYIFVAGVLFLLFSGAGISLHGQRAASHPSTSLVPNYIGAVYALLASAAALLYVLYISLPRMVETSSSIGTASFRPKELVVKHWELALLMVALLLALAFSAFAPAGPLWERSSWGAIAVAMTLAALGLAHGLVYHGLFRDLDTMERQRDRLKIAAESLDLRPTIQLLDFPDSSAISQDLEERWSEEEDFRTVADLYSTVFAFSDEPAPLQDFASRWVRMIQKHDKKMRPFGRELLAFLARSMAGSGPDYEYAPDEALEKQSLDRSIADLAGEIRTFEARVAAADHLGQDLEKHQAEAERLEAARQSLEFETRRKKAKLSEQQAQEELAFRSAFATGERVAPIFNAPGGPVGGPSPSSLEAN
jgi:hypothetical protein